MGGRRGRRRAGALLWRVVLDNGYTVAIVGSTPLARRNLRTCLPYGLFLELDGEFADGAVARGLPGDERSRQARAGPGWDGESFNTTIAVVATDAPLDQTQAKRMAMIANSGLARAIKPVHNLGDGDLVFGLATTPPGQRLTNRELDAIYNAAADALGRAVVHAVLNAGSIGERVGYCERYPSACRNREAARGSADARAANRP